MLHAAATHGTRAMAGGPAGHTHARARRARTAVCVRTAVCTLRAARAAARRIQKSANLSQNVTQTSLARACGESVLYTKHVLRKSHVESGDAGLLSSVDLGCVLTLERARRPPPLEQPVPRVSRGRRAWSLKLR